MNGLVRADGQDGIWNDPLYFRPDIEEFYVGYECFKLVAGEYATWFKPYIIEAASDGVVRFWPSGKDTVEEGQFMAKYLDKADLEKVGWEITSQEEKPAPYKVNWVTA